MKASLTTTVKRKGAAILVLALLFQLFPSVAVPGNGMPEAYAESSVTDSTYNTLQSYNHPDRNFRHAADFSVRIDPNVNPAEDAQWKIVPGLMDGNGYVSFESVNKPGYYITDNNFLAKLEQNDGTDRFKAAATFKRIPGLAESTAVSYQTYTDPDRYIRHFGFVLRLDPISTPVEKTDATFQEVPGPGGAASQSDAGFVHPGGLFKKSDLERMKYMVEAGINPWLTSFNDMKADYKSSYNYGVRGNPGITYVHRGGINGNIFELDVNAAYLNALMWAITGDKRHADKAVEILNAWSNLTNVDPEGTGALNAGLYAWKLVEAAEIIKSTYDGWAPADLQKFKDMLVYPGYSSTGFPESLSWDNGTFYWRIWNGDSARHGNQDMIAWRAMLSMGVFLDNRTMYERALRYFTGQPHKPGDMPYASGPSYAGALIRENTYFNEHKYRGSAGTIPDFGYNGTLANYVWENGQNQESSRDQQHAFFGLATAAGIAEVAWNQGYDVWNSLDNRLLKGFEFMSVYNTTYVASFPDQPTPWVPDNVIQRFDRTGRWFSKQVSPYFEANTNLSRGNFAGGRPVYEQAVAHFQVRMGMGDEALWTVRGRDTSISLAGYEKAGGNTLDQPGWGALTFRRPALMAGDPISGFANGLPVYSMNVLPANIEAENYDHFPSDGEGHTYHDLTTGNSGGEYRKDGVDIGLEGAGGYALTGLENGEWFTYSVYVPVTGNYRLNVRYAAAAEGGAIRFAFNGADSTNDVALPSTGGATNWKTYAVDDNVNLTAGIQVMRVFIGGDSQAFNLDRITVSNNPPAADYTKGSYYLYEKEVERIEAELARPNADSAQLTAELMQAEGLLVRNPMSLYSFEGNADNTFGSSHGTVNGTPVYEAGRVGQSIRLNGTDSFIRLPSHAHTAADEITVAAWVNWRGGNNWQRIFDFGNGQSQYMHLTPKSGSNTLRFAIKNDGGEQVVQTSPLPVNQWVHVAVTLGGGTAKLYVNGVQAASADGFTIKPSDFKPNVNYIGKSQFSDPLFNGAIDEFRVYNYALSAEVVQAVMNNTAWIDKSLLPLLIQEAAATGTEFYSQASVAALQTAVSNAQLVYDNANASQEEIDAATASLLAAIKLIPQEKVQLTQSMVTASSVSWDNKWSAAQNGWRAFDGNTATSSDTKTANGWVRVDLGAGNEQTIGSVKFYPRAGNAHRMNGALIQGSNDGTNFVTLYTISGVSEYKWYRVSINTDKAYRYLRYYTTNGYANAAELELYKR